MKILRIIPFLLSLMAAAIAHPDPSHSLEEIEKHLKETPGDPQLLYQKAEILLKGRRPEMARGVLEEALRISPEDPALLVLQARIAVGLGQREEAKRQAEDLIRRFPDFAPARAFGANLFYQSGRKDEAITELQHYIALVPSPDPADYLSLALWLEQRNGPEDPETAIRFLDEAIAKFGEVVRLQQLAVKLECGLRRYESALRRVDALVAKYQPSPAYSLMRADIHEAAGQYQEAARACDSAVALLDLESTPGGLKNPVRESIIQRRDGNLAK